MKYAVKLFYSEEDGGFIATIPELPGCSAFGETEEEALKEVKTAEELWIKTARKDGRAIPQPVAEKKYSGKFSLRVPPELYRRLVVEAKEEKVSINQLIVYKLAVG